MYFSLAFTLILQYVRGIKRWWEAQKQRIDISLFQKDCENAVHLLFSSEFSSSGTNSICVKVGIISNVSKCCSCDAIHFHSKGDSKVQGLDERGAALFVFIKVL